jgi:glycerophosphoryl diester phosphodiesterase
MVPVNLMAFVCGIILLLASHEEPRKHKLIVIAHRGDHTQAPENTLAAFDSAIRNGADYVEIDLRTSRDSHLVIMHDATLNRMTNGQDNVSSHTLAEIQQLKVQDRQHPQWGQFSVPSFEEVLKLCRGRIKIYLDFKDADVPLTYRQILSAGMEKSIVVYINKPEQFPAWRKTAPQIPLMVSLPRSVKDAGDMRRLLDSTHIDILDGDYDEYTPELVKAAIEKNVPIWADIQGPSEGPQQWDRALLLNLAGLQTDHPAALVAYLKAKGIR